MLSDRVRSLFGRSPDPLILFGQCPRLLFSVLRTGVFSPFPTNLFRPSPPCFFNRALSPCVFRLSLCRSYRRFVSPRRPTRPRPAARRLRPTLRIVVSPVRAPSVCPVALSPLCPDAYTPNGFVFRTTTPCDPFRPRAGFPIKQITPSPPYVFTASRVNSRPFSLPEWRLRPSVFEGPPRVNFSARAPVSLLNKQQPSPLYVFNRAAINLSHPPPLRPAYRQCTAAHKNHLSSSFCIQTGGRRPCLLLCLTAARGLLPMPSPAPRVFRPSSGFVRRFVAGRVLSRLVAVCVAAAAQGRQSEIGCE